MKNKYKLPVDIYNVVRQYVAGYERRCKVIQSNNKAKGVIDTDAAINKAIDKATKEIGLHIQSKELREKLINAIKENCIDKNASFERFDLQGISSYYFFSEKHKFLYTIATELNLI